MFSFHSTAAVVVEQAFYTIIISEFTLVVSFLFPFHSFFAFSTDSPRKRKIPYEKDRSL